MEIFFFYSFLEKRSSFSHFSKLWRTYLRWWKPQASAHSLVSFLFPSAQRAASVKTPGGRSAQVGQVPVWTRALTSMAALTNLTSLNVDGLQEHVSGWLRHLQLAPRVRSLSIANAKVTDDRMCSLSLFFFRASRLPKQCRVRGHC